MKTIIIISGIWFVLNLISFILFFIDKRKAEKKLWRIPESTLILSSVFGIIGGLCGMYVIRHKTKKPKFYITLPLILILEIIVTVMVCVKFL